MAAHQVTRQRDGEAGFTMIEVMVAVLLTAIAVIGIVGLHTAESRSGRLARHNTEASVLASDKMEVLRSMVNTSLAAGSETGLTVLGQSGGNYNRSWTVSGTTAPISYTVTVSWSEDGTAQSITMRSTRNQ
jgi:type IV pilus assembly protein PilV